MKRTIHILLIILLFAGLTATAQIQRGKKPSAPKTEQTKGQKKKQSTPAKKQSTSTSSSPRSSSSSGLNPRSSSPTIGTSSYTPDVKTYYANGISFQMVEVRGGTYRMGGTSEQGSKAKSSEYPIHSVTLSSYYIGRTEVTQALWKAVMGESISKYTSGNHGVGDNYPMYCISWDDCNKFISKLNSITGKNFRMPTEAEWEFAARGGTMSKGYKYSGSNTLGNVAWFDDNSGSKTHEVGTKSPNELGIYDMSGNVHEWCSDWYGDYSSSSQINPTGPATGSYRVLRGGWWNFFDATICRSSFRGNAFPNDRNRIYGLRLCLSE